MDDQTKTEDQLQIDWQKKAEDAERKSEEYLNNWRRERADFINYKKDELKRFGEIINFGNQGLILEILDLVDDLEVAAGHSESLAGEIAPILKKTNDWLAKYEVKKIDIGGKFDPEFHEAIEGSEEEGTKIEEIRAGYLMHGKVIRPARVRIIKNQNIKMENDEIKCKI